MNKNKEPLLLQRLVSTTQELINHQRLNKDSTISKTLPGPPNYTGLLTKYSTFITRYFIVYSIVCALPP